MRVIPVPCLQDNYAYLVTPDGRTAWVVDPSEGAPVLAALAREKLDVSVVAFTHHHPDHTGGADDVCRAFPRAEVVGFDGDSGRLPALSRSVRDGERLTLAGVDVEIRHVPGHTTGAIAYVIREAGIETAVFTGDTMFSGGCGRLFEGTPADMWRSLDGSFAALPDAVDVYPGHEYTASNLRFCLAIEPDNDATKRRAAEVHALRDRGLPSIPSTIGVERATNVFLRARDATVAAAVGLPSAPPVEVFAALRAKKDSF